jgi:hypothetical protein
LLTLDTSAGEIVTDRYYENERNGRPSYDGVFDRAAATVLLVRR